MQVLVILSDHEHRIETQPDDASAPDGMKEWGEMIPASMPFQRAWANADLTDATVSEIVNGYAPPPTS